MKFLPTSVGTRPRLACEIRPEGLVVGRGDSPAGTLTAVARADLRPGLVLPGLKAGNVPDRPAVVAVLRRALDTVSARGPNRNFDRSKYLTVVVPDACARVLLLDFDALPSKPAEALSIVRFRLKKLLPFDVDHALVSFQVMSSERSLLRVLAVAIPHEVLAEYESIIAEAGFQAGVVLPSTLAALAGLDPAEPAALVLNTASATLTTAIVRAGILLLHRTIELFPSESVDLAPLPPSSRVATLDPVVALLNTAPDLNNRSRDLTESISVAAAYFEDTLGTPAETVLAAGTTPAHAIASVLASDGLSTLHVREVLETDAFALDIAPLAEVSQSPRSRREEWDGNRSSPAAVHTANIPPGWLAGLRGALRS